MVSVAAGMFYSVLELLDREASASLASKLSPPKSWS